MFSAEHAHVHSSPLLLGQPAQYQFVRTPRQINIDSVLTGQGIWDNAARTALQNRYKPAMGQVSQLIASPEGALSLEARNTNAGSIIVARGTPGMDEDRIAFIVKKYRNGNMLDIPAGGPATLDEVDLSQVRRREISEEEAIVTVNGRPLLHPSYVDDKTLPENILANYEAAKEAGLEPIAILEEIAHTHRFPEEPLLYLEAQQEDLEGELSEVLSSRSTTMHLWNTAGEYHQNQGWLMEHAEGMDLVDVLMTPPLDLRTVRSYDLEVIEADGKPFALDRSHAWLSMKDIRALAGGQPRVVPVTGREQMKLFYIDPRETPFKSLAQSFVNAVVASQ